jgi:hypothetical protein
VGLLVLVGCGQPAVAEAGANPKGYARQDVLIGYDLLADTLSDESGLGTLDLFKTLTLVGPNDAIGKMMKTLGEASKRRASELSRLRRLAPDVSDRPAARSPIGDAITAVAKDIGSSEMTSRSGGFDLRFVLLQAQATRMVSAMATAIARFDPNRERKTWLRSLAAEYEGHRAGMFKYLEKKGDAQ